MLTIDKVSVYGFEESIRGMRNPMNSWDKSDSGYNNIPRIDAMIDETELHVEPADHVYFLGYNDTTLMNQLVKAGPSHRKFMRMIVVYMDICAPLYWWKEFDTYKVGTVSNSCSTMHKITAKKFVREDFSADMLTDFNCLDNIIDYLNKNRDLYLKTMDKKYWWQIIQTLPSSYNQKRTVMLSYEALHKMYNERKSHKLYEWISFCKKIRELPNSWLITGGRFENERV
jgi:hypothetical protein